MSQGQCHEIPGVQEDSVAAVVPRMSGSEMHAETCSEAGALPVMPVAAPGGRESLAAEVGSGGELAGAKDSRPRTSPPRRKKKAGGPRPPSAKDLEIYELAVIQEVPQRQVGEKFGITQSAVSRKCAKVIAWTGRCGRAEYSRLPCDERLRYLERFAEKMYAWYRQQAELAYRESFKDQVILKEKGTRPADGTPGEFVGEVQIEKTIRPQGGKATFLREARLALQDSVQLGWGCVGKRDLELIADPDEVARQQKEAAVQKQLAEKERMKWELLTVRNDLANTARELAEVRAELEALQEAGLKGGGDGAAEAGTGGSASAEELMGLMRGSDPLPSPNGLSSRAAEKDGVKFLDELFDLIASIEPVNEYDHLYRETLKKLWRNMSNNYQHHGILPERQLLPRLQSVRRGLPYFVIVPPEE